MRGRHRASWGGGESPFMIRMFCTKLGHHAKRDLGHIMLYAEGAFSVAIENQIGRPDGSGGPENSLPIGGYWSETLGDPDKVSTHIWCASCRQDMRFKARDFGRLARETPRAGRNGLDVSLMWAILMKQRHPD
jgi:hypothetical protein